MKRYLSISSTVVLILTYVYMLVLVVSGGGEGLSFTTFGLWAALGFISAFSMLRQGANLGIAWVYSTGATLIAGFLFWEGKYVLSGLDVVVACLTFLCVILWVVGGPRWALVLSVTSGTIAAIPFIVMTWRNPETSPVVANFGSLAANILAFAGAKAWTLEDRLYPSVNICLCAVLIIPWLTMP